MTDTLLSIKIDVDTDRGTRLGVPNLLALFDEFGIKATFLFSLGPDNTGRAIKRIFRPGFFSKVSRTSVVSVYGIRTLMNGVLLPGPHVGRRNEHIMREVRNAEHEVGIHCYDHIKWQDGLMKMTADEVRKEFGKAATEFARIFGEPSRTHGAAGWQANAVSCGVEDGAGLLYASDCRGTHPFFPRAGGKTFKTLQIPSTLPTLDELLGRPEYPEDRLVDHYLSLLRTDRPNVLTIHAELEGMKYFSLFRTFLERAKALTIRFVLLRDLAAMLLNDHSAIPVCDLVMDPVDGRSGTIAVQRCS
ncbi:MAG: 4-deoxy-4-formamido-L-arabinose-phosphoundecaprenol deformylase [Nitrospirota bacterium]